MKLLRSKQKMEEANCANYCGKVFSFPVDMNGWQRVALEEEIAAHHVESPQCKGVGK